MHLSLKQKQTASSVALVTTTAVLSAQKQSEVSQRLLCDRFPVSLWARKLLLKRTGHGWLTDLRCENQAAFESHLLTPEHWYLPETYLTLHIAVSVHSLRACVRLLREIINISRIAYSSLLLRRSSELRLVRVPLIR